MTSFPTLSRRHALGALLAASALLSAPFPAAAQDKPEVIRIGSTAPGHLKFILFRDRNLQAKEFAEDGIRVELSTFDGGSAATVALGSGAIDLTYIGNNPSLRLAASGADVKAVGLSSWVPGNETLVLVRADSDIQTLADLKGRKVAYLTGTVRHSTLAKALEAEGVPIAEVDSMNLGIDSSGPALARGDIDALVESGGTAQKLVDQGLARIIFDAAVEGKPEWSVPHVISANGEFARKYPDIVTRILALDIPTARWVDENPDETISAFVEGTGNAEASVRATYVDGKFFQNPEFTDTAIAALQAEEAFMAEAGLLRGKVDYDTWIDRSFYDAAQSRLDPPIN